MRKNRIHLNEEKKLWHETKMLWGIKMKKNKTKHSWNQKGKNKQNKMKKRNKHSLKQARMRCAAKGKKSESCCEDGKWRRWKENEQTTKKTGKAKGKIVT